jgi:AcrR family transcriptional regulator
MNEHNYIHSFLRQESLIDKKSRIYESGKELFEKNGFKNTNIAEIMRQSGFATGTFYHYYRSKDQLFMEIYNNENALLKRHIMESVDEDGEPIDVIKEITEKNLHGMKANPILKEWYNTESFSKIEQSFREEDGLAHISFLYERYAELIKKWQANGRLRNDISAEMIMALFSALISVDLHKDEIGLQFFPDIMDYLAEFIMKGLQPNHA